MNNQAVYKSRQEALLIEEVASSSFITKEQLLDIKEHYDETVPYHNFLHALTLAGKVLELPVDRFNMIEIKSLFLAALFHDAGHSWTAQDLDEFRSLDIAFDNISKFEKKYNYEWIDFSIVRKAIIWTVFKNRGKNHDRYANILADMDVHTLGISFPNFLYYCDFWMALEIGSFKEWKVDIEDWFKNIGYFKFLMWVNRKIFLTPVIRNELLKKALNNIERYVAIQKNDFKTNKWIPIQEIYEYWRDNDVTLDEFRQKFFINS